jgi:segregation and condensation protein B
MLTPDPSRISNLLREAGCPDADPHWVQVVGALIFTSPAPLPFARLCELLPEADPAVLEAAISALFAVHELLGIRLQRLGGGYVFTSAPELVDWVRRPLGSRGGRLTQAALETLAVVAYRQPVTLPEINEIRGVDAETSLKYLLDKNLVTISGRRQEPGRPHLYATTREFLTVFGLNTLSELPAFETVVPQTVQQDPSLSLSDLKPAGGEDFSLDFSSVKAFEEQVHELSRKMGESLGLAEEKLPATSTMEEVPAPEVVGSPDIEAGSGVVAGGNRPDEVPPADLENPNESV